jgi:uroporphyrinogen-III synthase
MNGPLAGKRVLVTRAREQSGRLAEALEALGAEVLRLPAIEIVPPESYAALDAALEQILDFDWLIVTSANGVSALANRLQSLGMDPGQLQQLQIAAVGPATAAALTRLGLEVSAMPEQYVGEALAALLCDRVTGKRVLLARAAVARDVVPDELRQCGAHLSIADTYRTVIPSDSVERLRSLFAPAQPWPDAVTFTSSSTVDNFFTLLAAAKMDFPDGLKTVSIGPVTSQTLRRHGLTPSIEAQPHDIAGLAAACAALFKA